MSEGQFDVVAYLEQKGHYGKRAAGGREMVYSCFFDCDEAPNSRKKKLSVNVEDGFHQCFVCGAKGGTTLLQRHFGDDPHEGSSDVGFYRRGILDEATDTGCTMLLNNDEVMLYLMNERGLEPETIISHKLGFIDKSWSLTGSLTSKYTEEQLLTSGLLHSDRGNMYTFGKDYFYSHLLIPYLHDGHTIQMRGRAWNIKGPKYLTGQGDPARVYNLQALREAEEVIVCEAELDSVALAQALTSSDQERLRKMAVIAVPGSKTFPDELLKALEPMKRVYIGFDSDEAGEKGATALKEKVGAKARILQLPTKDGAGCDWTDFLLPKPPHPTAEWAHKHPFAGHTWRDVAGLLAGASGKRVFSMAEAGVAWRESQDSKDWIKTGFRSLDAAISPGLLPGQLMVPLAGTGVGKTNFLCNLAYNMRSVPQLIVSLEMTKKELYARMRRIALFHNPAASDFDIERSLGNIYICDENKLAEADLTHLAEEYSVETGAQIRVMHIDYLGYFSRGFAGQSNYEKVGNAVMAMKASGKANGYTVISPSQVNRQAKAGRPLTIADARDAGQVEETADFLMSLFNPNDAMNIDDATGRPTPGSGLSQVRNGKMRGQLLKSRHGNVGSEFRFQMDMKMLAIVDEGTDAAKRAVRHNDWAEHGYELEDIVKRETMPQQTQFAIPKASHLARVS